RLAVELNSAAQKRDELVYLPYEPLDALDRAGHTEAVYGFLSHLLEQHPEIHFWENYILVAAKLGKSDEALRLVQKCASKSSGVTTRAQADLQAQLAKALLAADHIDEGVAALQRAIRSEERRVGKERRAR